MHFIIWLIMGGLIGWVASLIVKTGAQQGIVLHVVGDVFRIGRERRPNHKMNRPVLLLITVTALLALAIPRVLAQANVHPLEPLDRASPRATLASFLAITDALGRASVQYVQTPGVATAKLFRLQISKAMRCFDLSQIALTARREIGADATVLLWEVLARLALPPMASVPDLAAMEEYIQAGKPARWTIPHTEIQIALAKEGPQAGEYLGSINLFADRPVRVGDFCQYGDKVGIVEEIGLRSTRVRGRDRTVTTIPNADFSKMQITNFSRRDRMLLSTVLGMRYETTPDQLRHVVAKLRELLIAHPRVLKDPLRVRFVGFGDAALHLEVYVYVQTQDYNEFLGIQEDLLLRMMSIVENSGTGFAFPSQTLYLARDGGLDAQRGKAAEQEVQAWRVQQELPFPDFGLEVIERIRDTLDFPPAGSPGANGHPSKPHE